MRLIDADALKEKLDELEPYIDCDENSTTWILSDEVYNAVNNAPTVAYPFEKFRTMLCGTCQAYMRIEPERPQGEWIIHNDYHENCRYGCNQCGNLTNIPGNFCPNCGVKMKKEVKNND